jgi:hypothetical protein
MRIFVTHDEHGKICSIGTPSALFSGSLGVVSHKRGRIASVFDVAEIEHPHHLDKYLREFRVDLSSGQPKLAKKTAS